MGAVGGVDHGFWWWVTGVEGVVQRFSLNLRATIQLVVASKKKQFKL